MSVTSPNTDWEAILEAEGLGVIGSNDNDNHGFPGESINQILDVEGLNITYQQSGSYIYYKEKKIGFIHHFFEDSYLQFIGNINGCQQGGERGAHVKDLLDLSGIEITGLGKYMLEVFFSEFCDKGQEIKMRIENPRVLTILKGLKKRGIIKSIRDERGIPDETIIEV